MNKSDIEIDIKREKVKQEITLTCIYDEII